MYIQKAHSQAISVDLCVFCIYDNRMKKGRPKAKTPKAELVHIRLSRTEKQGFREAAELSGVGLSTWIRQRLRSAAIRELEGAGRRAPFVSPFEVVANG